jgi:hypothetical protein
MRCKNHGNILTIKTGDKDGKTWVRWSCNAKDGDKYCKEGEWAAGKTVSEEIANTLMRILTALEKPSAKPVHEDIPVADLPW